MIETRRLPVLQAVAAHGSVSAAARQLGYSPSAVSQQIAALEKETGIDVLERIGRGVRLTPAGHMLADLADVIGRHVAAAETALADLRAGRAGRLAVRYFPTAGATLVAPALAQLRRAYPGVRVELGPADPADPLREVREGRADVTLVVRPRDRPAAGGIRLEHLLDDRYRAVLPVGHRLAAKPALELADLAGEPWIRSEWPGPCLDVILDACAAAGFRPDFVVESEDYATAQGFVAAGLGVSLLPEMGLGHRHPGVRVLPVRHPEPVRVIHAAVRTSAPVRPPLRGLLDALRNAAS